MTKVCDGPINQLAAIIGSYDLNPGWQTGFQLGQFLLHCGDRFPCVAADAQNHDAADRFALSVKLGDSAPHLGAKLNVCDIAE